MAKLILRHLEVDAKKEGGEMTIGKDSPGRWAFKFDAPKEINVSVRVELVTSGDFSKYWDDIDTLKREVFEQLFGQYVAKGKFEIDVK